MKVVVTGATGFLGARVAKALVAPNSTVAVTELVLVDVTKPTPPPATGIRVRAIALDLTAPGAAEQLVDADTAVLFHLAAIVSGNAERDFDLGFRVNFDATRALLEAARRRAPRLVFVTTSSVAAYGGPFPDAPDEDWAPMPQTSYGCAKVMAELLASEYARRGWADARTVRLPTVSVRGGGANSAMSSFASDIVREPLAGHEATVPVPPELRVWLTGPATAVHNLLHAAALPAEAWRERRVLSLPGLFATVAGMVAALRRVGGPQCAARVRWAADERVARMMASVPARLDARRALALGFREDKCFDDLIREYIRDDLGGRIPDIDDVDITYDALKRFRV